MSLIADKLLEWVAPHCGSKEEHAARSIFVKDYVVGLGTISAAASAAFSTLMERQLNLIQVDEAEERAAIEEDSSPLCLHQYYAAVLEQSVVERMTQLESQYRHRLVSEYFTSCLQPAQQLSESIHRMYLVQEFHDSLFLKLCTWREPLHSCPATIRCSGARSDGCPERVGTVNSVGLAAAAVALADDEKMTRAALQSSYFFGLQLLLLSTAKVEKCVLFDSYKTPQGALTMHQTLETAACMIQAVYRGHRVRTTNSTARSIRTLQRAR